MTNNDEPTTAGPGRSAADEASRSRAMAGGRTRLRAGRPRWRWLTIGLLLAFSVAVTVLFAASLLSAVFDHHWAQALDDCRDAVPAVVGWAAVLIVLFAGGKTGADRMLSADSDAVTEADKRVARNADSVRRAEQRLQKLAARLAMLTEISGPGGEPPPGGQQPSGSARVLRSRTVAALPGGGRHVARQIADTSARLDQTQQWLASARAALAESTGQAQHARGKLASDVPESPPPPRPTAGRVA